MRSCGQSTTAVSQGLHRTTTPRTELLSCISVTVLTFSLGFVLLCTSGSMPKIFRNYRTSLCGTKTWSSSRSSDWGKNLGYIVIPGLWYHFEDLPSHTSSHQLTVLEHAMYRGSLTLHFRGLQRRNRLPLRPVSVLIWLAGLIYS